MAFKPLQSLDAVKARAGDFLVRVLLGNCHFQIIQGEAFIVNQ